MTTGRINQVASRIAVDTTVVRDIGVIGDGNLCAMCWNTISETYRTHSDSENSLKLPIAYRRNAVVPFAHTGFAVPITQTLYCLYNRQFTLAYAVSDDFC